MGLGPPVPSDHVGGGRGLVGLLGCCEGAVQLRLQAIEGLALRAVLVAADEIADVLAYVLVRAALADIRRDELAQGTADADSHGGCAGHAAPPLASGVFKIIKKQYGSTRARSVSCAQLCGSHQGMAFNRPRLPPHGVLQAREARTARRRSAGPTR